MNPSNVVSIEAHRERGKKTYLQIPGRVANETGSRPFLGKADDGNEYWCKRIESDHGREAVVNEVAASVVGQRLGAHIRPWKIIYVPPSLQGLLVGNSTWRYRLTGTPLFGSLNLHTSTLHQEFGVIPFVNDDANHNHIPKLIAMWALCNVQGDLQILTDNNEDNSIWSIDHGFWFDSLPYPWQLTPLERSGGTPHIPHLREVIPGSSWDKAITALDNLDISLKEELRDALPIEWSVPEHETDKLMRYVLERKDYTRELLGSYRTGKGQ
ncbi:HipA family kinase [Corynebacterium endometrii]|uniref:HipA-like kinase domain-containing protein n=1 Tax=Corynebacterium endometrii TaxID=2488819 RepID=A0A4P7QIW3_9CORY|nr:HipA family kinase [Corynebacterium endometrii]QCB28854.1 hypothetical protein CENDO_07900 [Corynebacterium endometrii]